MLTVTFVTRSGIAVTREVLSVEAHCKDNGYYEEVVLVDPEGLRQTFVDNEFFVMNDKGATVAKYDLMPAFARSKWANQPTSEASPVDGRLPQAA